MILLEQIENLRTDEEKDLLKIYPTKTDLNRKEQALWRRYRESGRIDVLYPTDRPSNYEPVRELQAAKTQEFVGYLFKRGFKPSYLIKDYLRLIPKPDKLLIPKRVYDKKVNLLTWQA
jgi:hypothetical protein